MNDAPGTPDMIWHMTRSKVKVKVKVSRPWKLEILTLSKSIVAPFKNGAGKW